MDSPETLATLGTRHRTLEKTLESNDEWTVQRHWQHWEQDIERRQNKKNPTALKIIEYHTSTQSTNLCSIDVREYRRVNQKWTIQRNWQHRAHKTKKNKTKPQHNMCWTPLYAKKTQIT